MIVKKLALYFVYLLSSQYMLTVASRNDPVPPKVPPTKESPPKRKADMNEDALRDYCLPTPNLILKIDQVVTNIQNNLQNTFPINNLTIENNYVVNGKAFGFKSFRVVGPFRCTCGGSSFARAYVNISFLQIFLDFTQSILADISSGLLGPLGTALAYLLGGVVNQVVKVLGLDINIEISIIQQFIPGTNASISALFIGGVSDVTIFGLGLSILSDALQFGNTPVTNLILENILSNPVRTVISNEVAKLVITKEDIVCDNVVAKIDFD